MQGTKGLHSTPAPVFESKEPHGAGRSTRQVLPRKQAVRIRLAGRREGATRMKKALALLVGIALILHITVAAPASGVVSKQATSTAVPDVLVAAKATPKRHKAIRAAYTKKGNWYRYGGNGPSSFDCSGLVA